MRIMPSLALAFAALGLVAVAAPSTAQQVAYTGALHIGLSDADNTTGYPANNALPLCAGAGPLVNPGTVGTLSGTLPVNARGTAVPGVGGQLVFNASSDAAGGADDKEHATCNLVVQPFFNPRLRSRTQVGSAHWPGRKGDFTTMIGSAPVPATPTAMYTLSAGGGITDPATVDTWTTTWAAWGAPMTHMGEAVSRPARFFGTTNDVYGAMRVQPGPARFGGGIPYSGGGGVQLAINFSTSFLGHKLQTFGLVSYANGFLPFDPHYFGTDHKGHFIDDQVTNTIFTPNFAEDFGFFAGRQNATFAARTPGGTTQAQSGAIITLRFGNTVTPATQIKIYGTNMLPPTAYVSVPSAITVPYYDTTVDCAVDPCPATDPIISPVGFAGYFNEWTTGAVTWTDMLGDFYTIRRAQGYDIAVAPSTAISGETRRIQLVSPWGASIRPVGAFGLPVPTLAFGGIARLELRVIPVPEPGSTGMLGFGALALAGLRFLGDRTARARSRGCR